MIERDFFVFSQALGQKIPILMVLSGGYSKKSAAIVSKSRENILNHFKLVPPVHASLKDRAQPSNSLKLYKK